MNTQAKISIAVVASVLSYAAYRFCKTVDVHNLKDTIFTLSQEQLGYLLLLTVCIMVLNALMETPVIAADIMSILSPGSSLPGNFVAGKLIWKLTRWALLFLGLFVPILNIFGSIPAGFASAALIPKITLILLTTTYFVHVWSLPERIRAGVKQAIQVHGAVSVLNREQDHEFMAQMLDEIEEGGTILVTQFEEPETALKKTGYYYEEQFMGKWYSTIRKKRLIIKQILLINSDQDLKDLQIRLSLVKDIQSFYLSCIVAPRMTVLFDFLVVPGRYALIGMSDDPRMRNMDIFSFLITGGVGVTRMEHLFTDVLSGEAVHVKTFEGIQPKAVEQVYENARTIGRSSSRTLRQYFKFSAEIKSSEED
jgi:hypothetical protein